MIGKPRQWRNVIIGAGLVVGVVLCISVSALGEQGAKSDDSVVVLLEMKKLDGKVVTPLLKSDSDARRGYTISRWTGESWTEKKESGRFYLRLVYGEKGAKVGVTELTPGKYRLVFQGNIQEKFVCDVEFEVAAAPNGEVIRIPVLHKPKIFHNGTLTIVATPGAPYAGLVRVSKKVAVKKFDMNRQVEWPTRRLIIKDGKPATFIFTAGIKDITFTIGRYAYRSDRGMPVSRTFTSKELMKGAVWKITRLPIMAKARVFLQTSSGVVPFIEAEVFKRYGLVTKGKYVRVKTYLTDAKTHGVRRSRDLGYIDMSTGLLAYRYLRRKETYRIGKYLEGLGRPLRIVSGEGREFVCKDEVVDLGKIVIDDPERAFQFSGSVVGPAGNPVKGTALAIRDSVVGTRTAARCDSNGKFSVSLSRGRYDVVVTGQGFYPVAWKLGIDRDVAKKFVLKSLANLVVSVKGSEAVQNRISVELFDGRQAGPVAGGFVAKEGYVLVAGIPAGKYLLVSVGCPRRIKSFEGMQFDRLTFAKKLVTVRDSRYNKVVIVHKPGWSVEVVPLQARSKHMPEGGAALLWGSWKKSKFMFPAGRIDAGGLGTIVVAMPGEYVMEVVIPKTDNGEKWKGADAYYSEAIEIKKSDRKVQYRLKEGAKHSFHPSRRPPTGGAG